MDEVEDPGIPVEDIGDDQKQLEEKARLEVGTFRISKLYDYAKYLYSPVKTSF
jgi:hypothetical protein